MKILFLNHWKSQCGVYEIGKRIFYIMDQSILPMTYATISSVEEYIQTIEIHSPDLILYNYTPYLNTFLYDYILKYQKIKHIAIHHDPIDPATIAKIELIFNAWIIHDENTNYFTGDKKFSTIRPIQRYERKNEPDFHNISIGTHGLIASHWKMYDSIIEYINNIFDNVTINMSLSIATFGKPLNVVLEYANYCRTKVTKPDIKLNIIHDYFTSELDLIDWLAQNTMNIYFYNANPGSGAGVGGSADLAISAQSSLAINDSYMYKHITNHLGFYNQYTLKNALGNYKDVQKLYNEWSPERMTVDYKNMIDKIM